MAGKYNTTVSARDMEMFQVFFDKESKRFGNSKEFKEVANAFKNFTAASMQDFGPEQSAKYAEAAQTLKTACEKYTADRKGAFTSKGKDRLETISQIQSYMPFWGMERSRCELDHAMEQPLNLKNAGNLLKANEQFKKDCKNFLNGNDPFRKTQVEAVQKSYGEKLAGVDQLRDITNMNVYVGKSWNEVENTPKREAAMAGGKSGANVSERFQATMNGKRGFFTAENHISNVKEVYFDRMLMEESAAGNKKTVDLVSAVSDDLRKISVNESWANEHFLKETELAGIYKANQFLKYCDRMPDGPEKEALKPLTNDYGKLRTVVRTLQDNVAKHDGQMNSAEYKDLLSECVRVAMTDESGAIRNALSNDETIQRFFREESPVKASSAKEMQMENYLLAKKMEYKGVPGKESAVKNLDEIIKDDRSIHALTASATKAASAKLADSVGYFSDNHTNEMQEGGDELTLRSVGMTRVADLLGVGSLIARAEKATAVVDGKEIEGCFMEFAEGIDITSKDPRVQDMIRNIEFTDNAGFNRDSAKIELLDYLCGQYDRHGKNMFYKLSEPNAEGKRNIIGIQGIDNDLAFGNFDKMVSAHQGQLEDIVFVDKDMANAVRGLNRETLEYALGDIISKEQIDAMERRVNKVKERLANNDMIEIEPDGWELNAHKLSDYPELESAKIKEREPVLKKLLEGSEERAPVAPDIVKYLDGLKSMQNADKAQYPWDVIHKNAAVHLALKEFNEKYDEKQKKDMEVMEAVGRMFDEKEAPAPAKEKSGEKVLVSFADMEKAEKNVRRRQDLIGAHRQRTAVNEAKKEDKGRSL